MVWPMSGPPDNGVTYGRPELDAANRDAILFRPDLPVDRDIGIVAETLRQQPSAVRSLHPVLSFVAAGEHAAEAVATQTIEQPLAPIEWLQRYGGDVLLIGVGHTRSTSIHFAEKLAGRKQFTRWAITLEDGLNARAVRLPNFPGCSDGFDAIEPEIARATTQTPIGQTIVRRIPLGMLIPIVVGWIGDDPEALLCARPDCERCQDVRRSKGTPANHG
jgi:aminoglycoside 3-N-acetyltransferase